jgi:ABC-type spermidine/putrescine transport system permease subunit II
MGDRHPGRSRHPDPGRAGADRDHDLLYHLADAALSPPDFSLRWYRELFDAARSAQIGAFNSVWVAGLATAIEAVLSVLAALAIARVARPSAKLLEASFLSPLILPTLSYDWRH